MDQRRVAARGRGTTARTTANGQAVRMRMRNRDAVSLLAIAIIVLGTPAAVAALDHRHSPAKHAPTPSNKSVKSGHAGHAKHVETKRPDAKRGATSRRNAPKDIHELPVPVERPTAVNPAPALPPDLAAAKQAIELVRQGKFGDASAAAASIGDPLARKLVEWTMLRHPDNDIGLARYTAFIRANPDWPSISVLRRRIEEKLWQGRHDIRTTRSFITGEPVSAAGRLALALAEMREGNRADAEDKVRAVWRSASLSQEMETAVLSAFPGVLTRADHVARMDRRIGARDFGAAMRAAKYVGNDPVAIVKACSSAETKPAKAGALLDAVPSGVRPDLGYALCRLHWLLRNDLPGSNLGGHIVTPKSDIAAAVKLTLSASPDDLRHQDTDEWWRQRRVLARKLLDYGDPHTAYRVARDAAPPANPYYRADFHFMPGWIALTTGAGARGKPPDSSKKCACSTNRPPAFPPPITGNWRAPGSASAKSQRSARRRSTHPTWRPNSCTPPTSFTGSTKKVSSGLS
jgi:soluble lytic murein transglycosylase